MGLQLLFDFRDMFGERRDFLRQLGGPVVKNLQPDRPGDVRQHGLIEF